MSTGTKGRSRGLNKLIQRITTMLLTITMIAGSLPELSLSVQAGTIFEVTDFHMTDSSWTGQSNDVSTLVIDRHPSVSLTWDASGLPAATGTSWYEAEIYVTPKTKSQVQNSLRNLADMNNWPANDPRRTRILGQGGNYWTISVPKSCFNGATGNATRTLGWVGIDTSGACIQQGDTITWQVILYQVTKGTEGEENTRTAILDTDMTQTTVDWSVGMPYMNMKRMEIGFNWGSEDALTVTDTVSYEGHICVLPGRSLEDPYHFSYGWSAPVRWSDNVDFNVITAQGAWADCLLEKNGVTTWFCNDPQMQADLGEGNSLTPVPGEIYTAVLIVDKIDRSTGSTVVTEGFFKSPAVEFTVSSGTDEGEGLGPGETSGGSSLPDSGTDEWKSAITPVVDSVTVLEYPEGGIGELKLGVTFHYPNLPYGATINDIAGFNGMSVRSRGTHTNGSNTKTGQLRPSEARVTSSPSDSIDAITDYWDWAYTSNGKGYTIKTIDLISSGNLQYSDSDSVVNGACVGDTIQVDMNANGIIRDGDGKYVDSYASDYSPVVSFTVSDSINGKTFRPAGSGEEAEQPFIRSALSQEFASSSTLDLAIDKYDGDFTFDSVLMDGVTVDPANYTQVSASVTLKNSYLQTLSGGDHTVTFHYTGMVGDIAAEDTSFTLTVKKMCRPVLTVSGNNNIDVTASCNVVWKKNGVTQSASSFISGTTLTYTVTPKDTLKTGGVQYYKETTGEVTLTEAEQAVYVRLNEQGTVTLAPKYKGTAIADGYVVKWYTKSGSGPYSAYSNKPMAAGGDGFTRIGTGDTSPLVDAGTTIYCDITMTGDNAKIYPNIEKTPVNVEFGNKTQEVAINAYNNITLSVSGNKYSGGKIGDDDTVTWYEKVTDQNGEGYKRVSTGDMLYNLDSSIGKKFYYEVAPRDYYDYSTYKTVYNWTEFHGLSLSENNVVTVTNEAQTINVSLNAVKKVNLNGKVTNASTVGADKLNITLNQDPFNGYVSGLSYYSYSSKWNNVQVTKNTDGSFTAEVMDFDTTIKVTDSSNNMQTAYKNVKSSSMNSLIEITLTPENIPTSIPLTITEQYPDGRADSHYGTTTLSRGYWSSNEGIFSDMVFTLKNGDTVIDPSLYQVTPSEVQFTGDVSAVIGMGDTLTLSYTVADIKGEVDQTSSSVKILRNYYAAGLDWDAQRFKLSYKDQPNVYFTSPDGRGVRHIIALYDANGDLADTITDSYYGWTNSVPAGTYTIVNIRETSWLSAPATLEALQGILGTDEYLSDEVTLQNGICTVVNFDSSPQVKDHKTFTENSKFGEETVKASTDEWALVKLAYEVDPAIAKANPGAQYALTVRTTMQSGQTYEQDVIPRYENTHTVGVPSQDKYINLYCDNKLTESTVKINAIDNNHLGTIKGFTLYTDKTEGVIWFYVQAPKGGDFTITATGARIGANNKELNPQTFGNMTLVVTASGASLSFDSDYLRTKDNGSGNSNKNSAWLYTTPDAVVKLYMDDIEIYSTRSNSAGVAVFVFTIDDSNVGNVNVSSFNAGWTVAGEHELYAVTTKGGNSIRSAITAMECLTKDDFTPAVIRTVSVKGLSDNERDSFSGRSQDLLARNYYSNPILNNYYWSLNDKGNVFTYEYTVTAEDGDRVDGDILLTVTGQNGEEYSTLLERVEGTNKFVGSVSDEKLLFTNWAVSVKSRKPDAVAAVTENTIMDADLQDLIDKYGADFKIVNPKTGQEQTIEQYYNYIKDEYVADYQDNEEKLVQDKMEVLDVFVEGMESYDTFLAGDNFDYSTLDNSEESLEALKAHFGIYEGKASDVDYESWPEGSYSESTADGRTCRATETSYIDDNGHLIMIWYSVMLPTDEEPDGYSYTQGLDCGQVIDPSLLTSAGFAAFNTEYGILKGNDEGRWPTMSDAGISKLASVGQIANDMHYRIVGKETTYSVTWAGMNAKYGVGALQTQHRQQTKAQISVETAIDGMLKDGGNKLDAETRQGLQQAKNLIREITRSTECADFATAMKVTMENINTVVSSLKGVAEDVAGATVDGVKYLKDKILDEAKSAAIDAAKGAIEDKIGVSIPTDVAEACSVLLDAYSSGKLGEAEKKTVELYLLMQSLAKKNKVRVNNVNVGGNRSGGSARATHDPEGVIYEAVLSNTVEGATATLYEKTTDHPEGEQWNAEDFGQINPQVTNASGWYQWFVPEGEWQVRVAAPEGSGLADNTSADNVAANLDDGSTAGWLPVMPVQLGINIPLVSTASPTVTGTSISANGIKTEFSLYMDTATLSENAVTVKLGDESISCNIVFPDAEADPADETRIYAKTMVVMPEDGSLFEVKKAYKLTITTTAKAYNGKALTADYVSDDLNVPMYYTISFDANGGTVTPDVAVTEADGKLAALPVPQRSGYSFDGWFTAAGGGTQISTDYEFAGDTTIYAHWTQNEEPPAPVTLSSISINTAPSKTEYKAGESFDPAGMVVKATYSDSSSKAVTGYTYSPNGALTVSDNEITVSYTEGSVTCTAKQPISVSANGGGGDEPGPGTVSLNSISINTAPSKTEYKEGEKFDPAGMVVTAAYTDASVKEVTGYSWSPAGKLSVSDNEITVSYTENDITCTAIQPISVSANGGGESGGESGEDVQVIDTSSIEMWNLYESVELHEYSLVSVNAVVPVENRNKNSAAFYDASLSGNTISVSLKSGVKRKTAANTSNTTLEFELADGLTVEFPLPVIYVSPSLKLSSSATIKAGNAVSVNVVIRRKQPSGIFEGMDLTDATVKYNDRDVKILENGMISIAANGAEKGKISISKPGWEAGIALSFNIKTRKQDVLSIADMPKTLVINTNAKEQQFEYPVYLNGEPAEDLIITDKKNTGLATFENGILTIAYPDTGVKKGGYTITLSSGSDKNAAKCSIKVKVSDKPLDKAVSFKIQSGYNVVTKQKMVIIPKLNHVSGKITAVETDKEGFTAAVNEDGNIVVGYEGTAYNAKNLSIGEMTFKLSIGGIDDPVEVTIKNVKAKKTTPVVKKANVVVPANASGDVIATANLVCTYKDSAGISHVIIPESTTIEQLKNVEAEVSDDLTQVNIKSLSQKSGSVKVKLWFSGGVTKNVVISVKQAK